MYRVKILVTFEVGDFECLRLSRNNNLYLFRQGMFLFKLQSPVCGLSLLFTKKDVSDHMFLIKILVTFKTDVIKI